MRNAKQQDNWPEPDLSGIDKDALANGKMVIDSLLSAIKDSNKPFNFNFYGNFSDVCIGCWDNQNKNSK